MNSLSESRARSLRSLPLFLALAALALPACSGGADTVGNGSNSSGASSSGKDLRAHGETEQRLLLVSVFREAPAVYTERERAAFAWAEAVTNVGHDHVPRDVFEEVRKHFDDRELVELTVAVCMINTWNRIAISFRPEVGNDQPTAR